MRWPERRLPFDFRTGVWRKNDDLVAFQAATAASVVEQLAEDMAEGNAADVECDGMLGWVFCSRLNLCRVDVDVQRLRDGSQNLRQRDVHDIDDRRFVPGASQCAVFWGPDFSNSGGIAPVLGVLGGRDPQAAVAVVTADLSRNCQQGKRRAQVQAAKSFSDGHVHAESA